jgi:hypothetical protein
MRKKREPLSDDEVTIEMLEKCLDLLAVQIELNGKEGEIYFPLWERLEREIKIRQDKEVMWAKIRERCAKVSSK